MQIYSPWTLLCGIRTSYITFYVHTSTEGKSKEVRRTLNRFGLKRVSFRVAPFARDGEKGFSSSIISMANAFFGIDIVTGAIYFTHDMSSFESDRYDGK